MTVYWNLVWLYTVKTCKSSSWPNWWRSNVGRSRISSLQHGSYFTKTWGWGFCWNENRPRLIMEQTDVKMEHQLLSWWTAANLYNISCLICCLIRSVFSIHITVWWVNSFTRHWLHVLLVTTVIRLRMYQDWLSNHQNKQMYKCYTNI